ncbi:hormogonium polysaccharide biosynthesis protein HpsA [Cylindrospermum sp. FACHB-282]|uniref:hormogonium polysaccharide biosynthesis protein HpsA n=1 Tax=Cylindrospermum sp. FACHB-282 TaxID=2692794 RepID=UPI0016866801|nr:hormogonium polysaccharide biosynthesis protein HpsA [Cylindrospermum sp. FACHB-282]MBD2385709.1 hypothetical protein [Cylindrospermum sp. FACHB-282]
MSRIRQLVKAFTKLFKQISKQSLSAIKKQIIWLLRTLFAPNRRRGSGNAGFVLPTVAMVSLVVVLLTAAILFRSFERSKNATNVRVNETALNAATPAIDRARAKLNKLFQDGRLPRATPTDIALTNTLVNNIDEYTFGDETKLTVIQGANSLQTAWRYPVDTDNNGKFDSYTLYGIYYKNPPTSNNQYERARNPLEARTPPMTYGDVSGDCGDTLGTSATLVGSNDWFKIGNKLKKAFFVYTATVPITDISTKTVDYELYKGSKSFSALEYQQDRVQLPLVNNAVIYEDDIDLTPGTPFRLNGRIFTNSNFLTGTGSGNTIRLYQVSSKESCFYEADNAKIVVGGNLAAGGVVDKNDSNTATQVDLFNKGQATDPGTSSLAKSTIPSSNQANLIAYNSLAYVQRLNRLVEAQMAFAVSADPSEVKTGIQQQKDKVGLASYTPEEEAEFRRQQLELYFKKRTRRVPYKEVAFGGDALGSYTSTSPLQGSGDTLRPIDSWVYPTNPTDGETGTGYTTLALNISGDKLIPSATEPIKLQKTYSGREQLLGDRVLVGNNLPQLWWDTNKNKFVGPNTQDTQDITAIKWDSGEAPRTRRSRVEILADLGSTDRDKDWELAAAKVPTSLQDPVGGLRVVTGAGIYLPRDYTTTGSGTDPTFATVTDPPVLTNPGLRIWSDMMPVASNEAATNAINVATAITLPNNNTPYLRMRATAVYHYKSASYSATTPRPIACVSSYYDPTNQAKARNRTGLVDVSAVSPFSLPGDGTNAGNSNNGIVYAPPDKTESNYQDLLNYQAELRYPNGRLVNKPLQDALAKLAANRTISEQSAIDAEICALQILDASIAVAGTPPIPHGAIRETAFLDGRQVKAIHKDVSTSTPGVETFTNASGINGNLTGTVANVPAPPDYDLLKQDRQPLEIRATEINIGLLRTTTIGGGTPAQEYLLPNSGIIYATRNDALLDLSASGTQSQILTESPVDLKLDPTRRPNAIMLVNGEKIGRGTTNNYRDVEKGLILATNLPVYVKGDFNKHTQEEFTGAGGTLDDNWVNFYTRTKAQRNVNFACRPGDTRLQNCTIGDDWRPASVLADSITLLSNNFRLGFRNEGDYDLNNNLGDGTSIDGFKNNGFFANAYVTNAGWYDTSTNFPKDLEPTITIQLQTFQGSSYLNNFVTPIQRRINAPEYLMEVCLKIPVSACNQTTDWQVKPSASANSWNITGGIVDKVPSTDLESGTTATPAATAYQIYPRRVAFERNNGALVLSGGQPVFLGIKAGKVAKFPFSTFNSSSKPDSKVNALWFKTTTANDANTPPKLAEPLTGTTNNPRLVPVWQNQIPIGTNESTVTNIGPGASNVHNNWLQIATETTFNLAAAAGDNPAVADVGPSRSESNGGLQNFVGFMENWNPTGATTAAIKARISGSFIQVKRSAYATAPFNSSLSASFYPIVGNANKTPFYLAPTRQWGYDVALLSQSPDLFAQKLVTIPDDLPDEYLREVGRDDKWVTTLLCARTTEAGTPYAIDQDQRPGCS